MSEISADDVLLAIQHQLNEKRMRGRDLFRKFDTSEFGDGEIHYAAFKIGLEELQIHVPDSICKMCFDFLDEDGGGGICLKELDRSLRTVEKNAKEDGVSSKDAAMKCGVNIYGTPKGMSRASQLRKQRSSFMQKFRTNESDHDGEAENHLLLKVFDALNEKKARAIDFFRRWDSSGDSMISQRELRAGFQELGLQMNDQEFELVMAKLDKDHDGNVSIPEFDKTLRSFRRRSSMLDLHAASTLGNAGKRLSMDSMTLLRDTSRDSLILPHQTSKALTEFGDLESMTSGALPATVATPRKKIEDPWPVFRYRPPKKPPPKPPTIGFSPRMCQAPTRTDTAPEWATVLGTAMDADLTTAEKDIRSMVTVRNLGPTPSRAFDSFSSTNPGPVDERQCAEWQLKGLLLDLKLHQLRYKGMLVPPGKGIASQCINIAGVQGFLKFWPNGYFNLTQSKHYSAKADLGGLQADSWCAIGLFMPAGTHFKLRFFVGDRFSQVRECYWNDGSLLNQIWMPADRDPPKDIQNLVIGVEVLKNCRHLRPHEAKPLPLTTPRRKKSKQPISASVSWSAREISFPAVDSPPTAPRAHPLEMTKTLSSSRTDLGLALPSPRFMSAREMRRKEPFCEMARVN